MSKMWAILQRLLLGLALIALTGGLLLISDLKSRRGAQSGTQSAPTAQQNRTIALIQHAAQSVLEDGAKGMIAGLREKGFVEGKNLTVKRYNPQGDLPTANAIAKDVVNDSFDLLLTVSTLSMQTVANANKAGKLKHVFGLVSDPFSAGVGINRTNPLDHPAHLTGYATLQPVEASFKIAREMRPTLKRVGVVFNPAESNSEAQLKLARKACQSLGIDLVEATADNSSAVGEAVNALIARGIEALWLPGDVTVLTAADSVIQNAKKGRIPTFSVIPPHSEKGALFDLGADYTEVGRITGLLAGDILAEKSPADVPVVNLVPEILMVNKLALQGLKDEWNIPDSIIQKAAVVIDENGKHRKEQPARSGLSNKGGLTRKWRIQMVNYNDSAAAEEVIEGIKETFKTSGLVLDKDYTLKQRNAQGDVATLNNIFDAAQSEGTDLFLLLSTPTLQVAMKKVKTIPVVFTFVANPMLAGAGENETNHAPNVTGISSMSAYAEMSNLLQKHYPKYKAVGTLFCPAEINSVYNKDNFTREAAKRGITVMAVAANTPSDLPDAAAALCALRLDAIAQISDNLSAAGFSSISKAASRARLPLFSFNSTTAQFGSAVMVSRDFHQAGVDAAEVSIQVMHGINPADIPFAYIKKTQIIVHLPNAKALNMLVPDSLVNSADKVIRQ